MLKRAREVIQIEADAIKGLSKNINKDFLEAVHLIAACKGRVIVTGMGKTGIVGRKIAATLSSTGTPSMWMHSAEAIHGDLGQLTAQDVLIVISYSGETEETTRLLPLVKKIGVKTIAFTGNPKSTLARHSNIVLNVHVDKEGCPLGLSPMASVTATLVMGDALAACLIDCKGFKREDFAFYHPGGSLGRRLLLKVEDIMRTGENLAKVKKDTRVKNMLLSITRARSGCACVVDTKGKLLGVFTDGDLRRHIENDLRLLDRRVDEVMTHNPTVIARDKLAAEAFALLKAKKIDEVPVVDHKGNVVGVVDVQDLLKAGLV